MIKKIEEGFWFIFEAHKIFQIDETEHGINVVAKKNEVVGFLKKLFSLLSFRLSLSLSVRFLKSLKVLSCSREEVK